MIVKTKAAAKFRAGLAVMGILTLVLVPSHAQETTAEGLAPPSTIVEIQDHGERFFDASDEAAKALNKIAEVDDSWRAAREAKAAADANPQDQQAADAFMAAKARWLSVKYEALKEAIGFAPLVSASFKSFLGEIQTEKIGVARDIESSKKEIIQQEDSVQHYYDELRKLKRGLPRGSVDLEPADRELMRDIERNISLLESQSLLAKERELVATESLRALQQTELVAQQRLKELNDEFKQARNDINIMRSIANNDHKVAQHEERTRNLRRFEDRQPIHKTGNRKPLEDWLALTRERLTKFSNRPPVVNETQTKEQDAVDQFLESIPDAAKPDATNSQ
jgi:hypothetical protein